VQVRWLVQVRWQGDDLVLKGVSQRELLRAVEDETLPSTGQNCQNCRFMRGNHCRSSASPLYGLRVTPDGFCPAFEARSNLGPDSTSAAADSA